MLVTENETELEAETEWLHEVESVFVAEAGELRLADLASLWVLVALPFQSYGSQSWVAE